MAKQKIKFKRSVVIFFWSFIAFLLIVWIESQLQDRKLGNVSIQINNQKDNYFLDTLEIKRLLTQEGKVKLEGTKFRNISIKTLESRVKANLYVDKCEIARNLRGDLVVKVVEAMPIARFIRSGKPDFYVDSLGKIIPISDKFTKKVLLVSRADTEQIPDFARSDHNLLKLLKIIYHDAFLRAQIAQIDILKTNAVVLYPQIGRQVFELGTCIDLEAKLQKLKIYYQEIVPLKGWNFYKKINLRFENQIVCE